MKQYTVMVRVILPDGSVGTFPALRFDAGVADGVNKPQAATFTSERDARDWQRVCLQDRAFVRIEEVPS